MTQFAITNRAVKNLTASASMLTLSLAVLMFTAGCSKSAPPAQSSTAQPAPAAAPAPGSPDASAAPAPAPGGTAAPAPAPEAAAPTPVSYTVPAGTRVSVRIGQTLSSKTNSVGEGFEGTLVSPITSNGVTIFKSGTSVSGTVVSAKGQGRFKGEGNLGIALTNIGRTEVHTSEFLQTVKGKGKRTAVMAGGGTGLGAIIGGVAGGGKGALIGGLAGAGAGTAGAAFTGNKAAEIPAETVVTFRLSHSITVTR